MKFKIDTKTFKEIIDKSIKGSGKQLLTEESTYLTFKLSGKNLTLLTSDTINVLKVTAENIFETSLDDTSFSVNGQGFSKLIQKTTSKEITFEIKDDVLSVKGNGVNMFPCIKNKNGTLAELKEPDLLDYTNQKIVQFETLRNILQYNKIFIEKDAEQFIYSSYFSDKDQTLSFNGFSVALVKDSITDLPVVLHYALVDLFELFSNDHDIIVDYTTSQIKLTSENVTIYSSLVQGEYEYPSDNLREVALFKCPYTAIINRNEILSSLARMEIFVKNIENDSEVIVEFHNDKLILSDKKSNNFETVYYSEPINSEKSLKSLYIKDLVDPLKSHSTETVEISFGHSKGLFISNKDAIQCIPYSKSV